MFDFRIESDEREREKCDEDILPPEYTEDRDRGRSMIQYLEQ
jgi:hypothetical protein